MKQSIFIVLLLIILINAYGQSTVLKEPSNNEKMEFKNQGEQEDYWAKELFKKEYIRKTYNSFSGKIFTLDNKNFHFGNRYFEVTNTADSLMKIFSQGLIYPDLLDKSDGLTIANLREQKFLSTDPTIKRFKFWVFRMGLANPQVYSIELTNKDGKEATDMNTFLKGSTLTFVKPAWIVL